MAAAQPCAMRIGAAIGETESVAVNGDIVVENTRGPTFQSDRCRERQRSVALDKGVRAGGTMAHRKIVATMFGMAVEKEAELTHREKKCGGDNPFFGDGSERETVLNGYLFSSFRKWRPSSRRSEFAVTWRTHAF